MGDDRDETRREVRGVSMGFIQEIINKILNRLKLELESLEAKFYFFGIIIISVSILMFKIQNNIFIVILFLIGILLFCAGVLVWCFSLLKRKWVVNLVKVFLVLLNVSTYFLAEFISRNLIAETIYLPVRDFDFTLKILTSIFYIPIAVYLSCIFLMVIAFLAMIVGMIIDMVSSNLTKFKHKYELKPIYFCRIAGIVLISSIAHFVSSSVIIYSISSTPFVSKVIKYIAFYGDYQLMKNYPDVKEEERIILHENGVISSASQNNDEIVIKIRKFEE